MKKPYMAIITTRVDLSDEEIYQTYKKRWRIEQGFRILKSWFGLITGNSSRLFETNIALVAIAHMRFALLVACQAIKYKDKSLNQVRKELVKESIFYKDLSDIVSTIQILVSNVVASIKETKESVINTLKIFLNSLALEIRKQLKELPEKLIDEILLIFYGLSLSCIRLLKKELNSNRHGVAMLRDMIFLQNIMLHCNFAGDNKLLKSINGVFKPSI